MEASKSMVTSAHCFRNYPVKHTQTNIWNSLTLHLNNCKILQYADLPLLKLPVCFYYWIIAYPGCLLCPWWPGMALCETPSWECPWINLGLAQDCLGLLGDGGGLAVTACFGGVRAIGSPNCPWLRLREQEVDRTTPTVEPPATGAIHRL